MYSLELEREYVKNRVDERIDFFLKKSEKHRKNYVFYKIIEIISAFMISVFCAFDFDYFIFKVLSVSLSSLFLICEGIIALFAHKENWLNFKNSYELLNREKYLYQFKVDGYTSKTEKEAFSLFVKNCETIITTENSNWIKDNSKNIDEIIKIPNGK